MSNARRYRRLMAAAAALWTAASPSSAGSPATAGSPSAAAPMPDYHITRTVALGAPDRWDYVVFDAPSGRVYVAHGDRVSVVDGSTGSIVGQVEGFPGGTHGIALVHALGLGFTDDGQAGQAGGFDLETFKSTLRIKADKDADSLVFDPVSGHVFVVNGDSGTITVIDPKQQTALANIRGGGKLETALAAGDGKLYVNGAENSEILRVDTATNQIDARWPIAACSRPHGIAIDAAARRLFSSCVNNVLVVVNLDSGATVATLPIGSGSDSAAFDPKRKLIFSANGRDGTLSIIQERDPQTFVSLGSFKTAVTARTMAIDPGTGRIYLAAGEVDPTAAANAHAIVPGSLKLLFVDPTPMPAGSGH